VAQVAGSRAGCSRTGGCASAHSSMSAAWPALQAHLASHMLNDDVGEDASLDSDADCDADHDSMDGMFHDAADAVAAAVAASPTALQQDDQLLLYGLYKQVDSLHRLTAVHVVHENSGQS
jgi:hypothetical protein